MKYNDRILNIILTIINKSKLIPKKSLNNQSFLKFCRTILSPNEYNILKVNIEDFEYIYNNVSAMFAITLFINDINGEIEYYIMTDDKNLLSTVLVVTPPLSTAKPTADVGGVKAAVYIALPLMILRSSI